MTKGKFAARAANRMAQLDNDLLQEKCAEVAALKQQLADATSQLAAERRERGALVLQRADELSAQEIKNAKDAAQAAADTYQQNGVKAAVVMAQSFRGNIPTEFVAKVLPLLVPDQTIRSHVINRWVLGEEDA